MASPTKSGTAPFGSPIARLIGGLPGGCGSSSVANLANADGGSSVRRPGKSMRDTKGATPDLIER